MLTRARPRQGAVNTPLVSALTSTIDGDPSVFVVEILGSYFVKALNIPEHISQTHANGASEGKPYTQRFG